MNSSCPATAGCRAHCTHWPTNCVLALLSGYVVAILYRARNWGLQLLPQTGLAGSIGIINPTQKKISRCGKPLQKILFHPIFPNNPINFSHICSINFCPLPQISAALHSFLTLGSPGYHMHMKTKVNPWEFP